MVTIKSNREIELMKEACKIANLTQKAVEEAIIPGVSTMELDRIAEQTMRKYGAIPAQKGYPSGYKDVPNFPATICASINEEVIHGIPSNEAILKEGDIVSIDLVAYKEGFHGDCARTYAVGKISKEAQRLIDVTKQAFFEGVSRAKSGSRIGDVSYTIGEYVQKNGFSVVREFEGHGIGRQMHEAPGVPNFGRKETGVRLEPGMTIAVEPMVCYGKSTILELEDGWTIVTKDRSLAAHYENTILITKNEPEILTMI